MAYLLPLVLVSAVIGDPAIPASHDPVVITTSPSETAALLESPSRRVRATDRRAERLLAEGMRRSRTFASLVRTVQKTDVIVYIESTASLPPKLGGRLLLQGVTANERYLRVQIRDTLTPNAGIEVLAHELRHALEVAEEPSVTDEAGFVALYRRIGYRSSGAHAYDTNAARLTSHVVRRELGG